MPRWLASTLIVIGFLALTFLAIAPRNVTVIVDVDEPTQIQNFPDSERSNPRHAEPAQDAPPIADEDA